MVSVRCPIQGVTATDLLALIDTGADRTVLPEAVVNSLRLASTGTAQFQGFGGGFHELPLYMVDLVIHEFPFLRVRPVLGASEPFLILGRDILNHFRIVLDGPDLSLEMYHPQTDPT